MAEKQNHHQISWSEVSDKLNSLTAVDGGFTQATRGILKLDDGQEVFVKQGSDPETCKRAQKEIRVYRFLESQGYSFIPQLLATNPDETGFVLSAHLPKDGWDWKGNWTSKRITKTLEAMDVLSELKPDNKNLNLFLEKYINQDSDGWLPLLNSEQLQQNLFQKLHQLNFDFDLKKESTKSKFVFQDTHLVHNDVRSDNCAWNKNQNQVCLIDWDWCQIGDRRVDIAATLVDIASSGFDISPFYSRLDAGALHWLVGYWFKSAASPGPDKVRDFQLNSGLKAWELFNLVK